MKLRFGSSMRRLTVAAFAAAAVLMWANPASAEDTANRAPAAKRSAQSFAAGPLTVLPGSGTTQNAGFANGFLYLPGTPGGVNVGGRVPVGKSHVYVPYYGNVSNDPAHPGVQGTAGIAYGFRTWDISLYNGGTNTQQALPGFEPPKTNPALSLSVRF